MIILNGIIFWGMRYFLIDGKYKLGYCIINIVCIKVRKISVDFESSYVLSIIYSNLGCSVFLDIMS